METKEIPIGELPEFCPLMDPSCLRIFTINNINGEVKSYSYNFKKDPPPVIPREEKRIAETAFIDTYDKREKKQKALKVDLLGSENIGENISHVVAFYNQEFKRNKTTAEGLVVMVTLPEWGVVKVPFEKLVNPTQNLLTFLNNLPDILERRQLRFFLRDAIEAIKKEDEFLRCLYQKDDDGAKELILKFLKDRRHFSKESLNHTSSDYFDKFLERAYSHFTLLRDRFSFDPSLLNLKGGELEGRIREMPATPNALFIPLIDRGDAEKREIPLSSVITAEARETGTLGNNWLDYLINRGEDYMRNFLRACLRGDLNLMNPDFDGGYNLLHLGNGFHMVLNGRHRTVASKLLGLESTEANVYNLLPKNGERREVLPGNEEEIRRRIDYRLIEGKLFHDEEGRIFVTVESYQGPWVFYKDMDEARKFFTSSNSSSPPPVA